MCEKLDQLTSLARDLNDANVLLKTSSDHPMGPVIQALAPARHVTTLTMNSSALVDNVRMLKAHVGAHGVIAVVKGLGYGTDPVVLGRLLEAQGVDWLAVAYADEGVALREAGIQARILVLNPDPATFDTMHRLATRAPVGVDHPYPDGPGMGARARRHRLASPPKARHRHASFGARTRGRRPRGQPCSTALN